MVEIFAEMREADLLLSLADKICPAAMRISQKLSLECATSSHRLLEYFLNPYRWSIWNRSGFYLLIDHWRDLPRITIHATR